jgi:flavorubredoxin
MRKAIVVYDSKFGNTEKIAKAFSEGMRRNGLSVDCTKIDAVNPTKLADYDLLAIGAPTQAFSISGPMKDFLKKLEKVNLKGKDGFAFDTRLGNPLAGSAAKGIEKKLKEFQVTIVRPRASANIKTVGGKTGLEENAEKEFEQIGSEIAKNLLKANN